MGAKLAASSCVALDRRHAGMLFLEASIVLGLSLASSAVLLWTFLGIQSVTK